jgi:hypothetical protein
MRGGPGGSGDVLPICLVGGWEGKRGTKWNRNAKKSEKLERKEERVCVRVREIQYCTGVMDRAIAIVLRHASLFFLGRHRDMIGDSFVTITATAARGVEACTETPLRSVSAERLHSHMDVSHHPAGLDRSAHPPPRPSPRSARSLVQ